MEVPGGTHTDVVVAVAVPVVDVETVLVEVADARDVTGVHLREVFCLSSSMSARIEFYRFWKPKKTYILFSLYLFGSIRL